MRKDDGNLITTESRPTGIGATSLTRLSASARHLLVILLLLALPGIAGSAALQPGNPAPGFELPDLAGRTHSLDALRKQGHVLLLFWSVNCHFCHAMIPEFKELHTRYAGRGLTLVAVNVGYESLEDVQQYASDNDLPYLILDDDERKEEIIETYGLIGTPTFVLVAPDGRITSVTHQVPPLPAPQAPPPAEPAPAPAGPPGDELSEDEE